MKIAFLDTVHEVLEQGLSEKGFQCVDLTVVSDSKINEVIDSFDGIVVRSRFKLDQNFLQKCSNLKFIARSGAGMENIDIAYCEANNVKLFNAPEGNRNAVGEHALGMILSLFNRLHFADSEVRSGKWDREGNRGEELDGKVIGIIGYGNNGRAFSEKLRGFDVEIVAYDKYVNGFGDDRVSECSLEKLQNKADIISLHIPQNEETKWMINREFIEKCSKPFYLINLSRGKIVTTKDLLEGLNSGKIRGACLDVLEFEKSSFEDMFDTEVGGTFKKLLESEKVILSPHVGGWTVQSYYKLSKVLLDKICLNFKA